MKQDDHTSAEECAKDFANKTDDLQNLVCLTVDIETVDGGYWVTARVWASDAALKAHVPWAERQTSSSEV
jgi:hypothetical protein